MRMGVKSCSVPVVVKIEKANDAMRGIAGKFTVSLNQSLHPDIVIPITYGATSTAIKSPIRSLWPPLRRF